jgi:hypothetical protein
MDLKKILTGTSVAIFLTIAFTSDSQHFSTFAQTARPAETKGIAVAPQYDTTHVYVSPQDFDRFVASLIATFGGTTTKQGVFTVTPTPSETMSQLVLTPVGTISVFGFKTPIPYPFGAERTGYLVTDLEEATRTAVDNGANVLVSPFNDPIGRDVVMQWPGPISERYSSRLSSGSAALTFTRLFHSSRQFSNCVPPRRSDPTKESAFVQDAQSNLIDS